MRHALAQAGPDAFRQEVLRHVDRAVGAFADAMPFYERHGERRVAEGAYARVLRRDEHLLPIAEALACES